MTKIYNEVVIDMNPESPDFEKVIHEDSYEYDGEMMLMTDWEELPSLSYYDSQGNKYTVHGKKVSSVGGGAQHYDEMQIWKTPAGGGAKEHQITKKTSAGGWEGIGGAGQSRESLQQYTETWLDSNVGEANYGRDPEEDITSTITDKMGTNIDWGAANIELEDFYVLNADGSVNRKKRSGEIARTIWEKLGGEESGYDLNYILGEVEKYAPEIEDYSATVEAARETKSFAIEDAGTIYDMAKEDADIKKESDIYSLKGETESGVNLKAATQGDISPTIAKRAAVGRRSRDIYSAEDITKGRATDAYDLATRKAEFDESEAIRKAKETAVKGWETDVGGFIGDVTEEPPDPVETGRKGGLVTKDGLKRKSSETFSYFLSKIPEAGGN